MNGTKRRISFQMIACTVLLVVTDPMTTKSSAETEEFCLPPLELGVYIRYFMLDEDERAWWTMRADEYSLVEWLTDDVEYDTDGWESQRRGKIRLLIDGQPKFTLRQYIEELPWYVIILSDGDDRWPPWFVRIEPDNRCFGSPASNCEFDILPILQAMGISYQEVPFCPEPAIANGVTVYKIESYNKKPAYLAYYISTGSGGSSNWIELYWDFELLKNNVMCL